MEAIGCGSVQSSGYYHARTVDTVHAAGSAWPVDNHQVHVRSVCGDSAGRYNARQRRQIRNIDEYGLGVGVHSSGPIILRSSSTAAAEHHAPSFCFVHFGSSSSKLTGVSHAVNRMLLVYE